MNEEKGSSALCGSLSGILGLVFFIYLMVAFSTVNLKDLNDLDPDYVDMINWTETLAFVEFGLIGSMFFFTLIGGCCIMISENAGPVIVVGLYALVLLSAFIVEIIFVAEGVPIKNSVDHICQQSYDSNYIQMCNFYNNYYNPLFIILCVLLGLNCLNFLIIGLAGMLICLFQTVS